jgi:hypothetical protein
MKTMWNGLTVMLLAITLTAGCGMKGGPSGTKPVLTNPSEAANLTFYRDGSLPGWFATIKVVLNGHEILRVARNEAYTITVDPGQHILIYTIGFNECRQVIWARPRDNLRFRLSPTCT